MFQPNFTFSVNYIKYVIVLSPFSVLVDFSTSNFVDCFKLWETTIFRNRLILIFPCRSWSISLVLFLMSIVLWITTFWLMNRGILVFVPFLRVSVVKINCKIPPGWIPLFHLITFILLIFRIGTLYFHLWLK